MVVLLKMITFENVALKAQFNNFLFHGKHMFLSQDLQKNFFKTNPSTLNVLMS